MDCTVVLVKPDAGAAASEIVQLIESSGVAILAKEQLQVRVHEFSGYSVGHNDSPCRLQYRALAGSSCPAIHAVLKTQEIPLSSSMACACCFCS